jgi:cardiolipin synthase
MPGEAPEPQALAPDRWITAANALTAIRLALIPAVVYTIGSGLSRPAFAIFWLAVATDLFDGRVARRRGEASRLGGFLDHASDALFVSAGLAACAARDQVPFLLPPLVLIAFVQYALDSRVLAGRRLRTSTIGRTNGIAYFVLLGIPVGRDALGLGWPPDALVSLLGWLLVASTLVSMADRACAWRATRTARDWRGAGRRARWRR